MHKVVTIKKGDILQFMQPIQGRIAYMAMSTNAEKISVIETSFVEDINNYLFTPAPIS